MESCLGEESFQMWGLNRRLEAYLARVKALEEQNELLSAELVGLRARSGDASWRARAEDELAALRALVDQRWREKHEAEVARDSLEEEAQSVAGRCQQQRLARERTAEEAARSRRAAEAERCSQAWLSRRAAGLERELEALRAAHEQERADLAAPAVGAPRLVRPPRGPPAPGPDVEELALRMGEAWRGAVRGYQERVARMETALDQARQRLGRVVQGAREGRLELQQLQAERGGLQERRAALEQRLEGRWQERLQATEKFQLAVGALEQEKQGLQSQIAQILEGRQQLAHLKMSLSLEVATYRTLLEAENSRLQAPGGGSKASFSFQDPKLELHFPGTPEGRRPGPLLSVLSPTPLPSPLPDSLEIPVPTFLKSQETVQARTPTLASTPIPLTHQAPFPATDGETGAQDGPLSVLHPQAGRQRVAQAIPASTLPGPEEPGGQQPEAGTGQPPEDPASLAPPLSPDHPSLEAKDGEPSESGVCGRFQEEGEGQARELAERAAAMEVKAASSLQQETQEEHLDGKGIQDAQCLLEKATLESLEEDIQEPLMSLEHHSQEPPRSPEKGAPELLEPLEEKEMEIGGTLEKETRELLEPIGKEDTQTLPPLEQENQVLRGSLEDDLEAFLYPGKGGPDLVRSLDEEDSVSLAALEKQNQEPLRALEGEDQETMSPLEKENQEPLRPLEDENQVVRGPVEKEIEQPLRPLGQDQTTVRPPGELKPEPPGSPGKDREILGPLEKGNQELLRSFREESVEEAVRCSESESLGPLRSAGEELEALKSIAAQEPLWPLGDVNQETTKPLEKEVQEPLGSVEENQESLRSLGEWNPEQLRSAEEVDKESPRDRGEEESPEEGGNQETPPRPLEEQGQELLLSAGPQRQEEVAAEDQERDPEMPLGRAGVDEEGVAELGLREHGGLAGEEEGELPPTAPGPAWSAGEGRPGSPEPKEQRVPAEGASGEGDVEGLQDPEGQPEQVGDPGLQAPWGMSEAPEQVLEGEAEAPGGGRAAPEVTLGLEAAMDECEAGDERGPEEEAAELEDPGHLDTEQVLLGGPLPGEEGWKAQGVQGLEGPRQDLEEAAALEPELPMQSGAPLELPGAGEELEPEDPWGAAAASPAETLCQEGSDAPPPRPQGSEGAEEDAEPVLGPPGPRPPEPWSPTPIPKDAPGSQPPPEGGQEAGWGLASSDAPGEVEAEQEELGSGEFSEGLQDEGDDSRDESEADGLGETLPDSTPLGLYLRSPASPQWDLAGEQRPSPQGDSSKEGWGPAVLTSEAHGAHPEAEEDEEDEEEAEEAKERGDEDEEQSQDSDVLEEFEDLGTEASLLPGDPREVMGPLRQVSQLPLQPAAWGQDGESDGFADEEASGEEAEEGEQGAQEPGAGQWGLGFPVSGLLAPSGPQTGKLLGSETVDGGLRGAAAGPRVTVLETESQGSTEPSGSEEEPEAAPLEREAQAPGPLGTLGGTEGPPGVNGQGPSLKDELEHVNGGVANWLERSEGAGQGGRGSPLEGEKEGSALKAPWAGAPLHLGPSQFLQFSQREADADSWSSGED